MKAKSAKKDENKEKEVHVNEVRSRWIGFFLYPDDRYHMEYLIYIKTHNQGFYILHHEDSEGILPFDGVQKDIDPSVKKHYHVILYFENARTASAFVKSLPVVRYLVTERDEDNKIKSLSSNTSNYDARYYTIDKYYDDYVYKPLISHAEAIKDIYAMCHYLIHDNFECFMLGKRKYNISDVKMLNNDRSLFDKYFHQELPTNNSVVELITQLATASGGDKKKFMQYVLNCGDPRVLKYIESHSYFVSTFLM